MEQAHPLVLKLREIAAFLAANGEGEMGTGFQQLADEFPSDPEWTKAKVRQLFGGMGSFNEFYVGHGRPLERENNELHRLKDELYDLSQNRAS